MLRQQCKYLDTMSMYETIEMNAKQTSIQLLCIREYEESATTNNFFQHFYD